MYFVNKNQIVYMPFKNHIKVKGVCMSAVCTEGSSEPLNRYGSPLQCSFS